MTRLDTYSGDDVRNCTLRCECGEPKERIAVACEQCDELDGKRESEAQLISALRTAPDWLNEEELCEVMGRKRHTLHRLLVEMHRAGRLVRQLRQLDSAEQTIRCRYGGSPRKAGTGGRGCWEYSLATKRRAA